jgi:hypothetical protein
MNTNINPQTRNKRIPMAERINNFVQCAVASGYANRDMLTRKEVYDICEQTGIVYPRWLAKNPERRLGRGEYSFPELKAAGSTTMVSDDMVDDIGISDDMIDVDDATVTYTDVLTPDATVTIKD